MRAYDLKNYVIRPVLNKMGCLSKSAESLLLGTAAVESDMGYYLHQKSGPALGIYQMEPRTHDDILNNYLRYRPDLLKIIQHYQNQQIDSQQLISNLSYATAMTRAHYLRVPKPLPTHLDVKGLAKYWKKYYNTEHGAGTIEHFINAWQRHIPKSVVE